MIESVRGLNSKLSVREWVQSVPCELSVDAVGLWQIVPAGVLEFGLDGADLIEFVRLCISALLEAGAKPVVGIRGAKLPWILQPQYGATNSQIAESLISEWLAASGGEPKAAEPNDINPASPGGIWFALPKFALSE